MTLHWADGAAEYYLYSMAAERVPVNSFICEGGNQSAKKR